MTLKKRIAADHLMIVPFTTGQASTT